jgi:hypothetical protein
MSKFTFEGQIQTRFDTSEVWSTKNPILLAGELGIETDTNYIKRGDGSKAWNDLEYIRCPSDVTCSVQASAGSSVWIEIPWEHVSIISSSPTGTDALVIELSN